MKDLEQTIKVLERLSLYRFKELNNPVYNYMVLYFSPDDEHNYVGFTSRMDSKTNEKNIICYVGKFYVDTLKQELFVDTPDSFLEVSVNVYQKFYKQGKNLLAYTPLILSDLFSISPIINEKLKD